VSPEHRRHISPGRGVRDACNPLDFLVGDEARGAEDFPRATTGVEFHRHVGELDEQQEPEEANRQDDQSHHAEP
jgi:hypothetical protein